MESRISLPEAVYKAWMSRRRARFTQFQSQGLGDGAFAWESVPVVSVGNLTLGGTGKTPCVRWIARQGLAHGLRPAIVSRGYGGSLSKTGKVVSDGSQIFATAREAGDEPIEHARALPGVPVLIGRDRHAGARQAAAMGADFVILDDGFGFWSLRRECDLVLLDARAPLGNGRLLPLGRLREEPESLERAHAVLFTRCDLATPEQLAASRNLVARFCGAPIWESRHAPRSVCDEHSRQVLPLQVLEGAPVLALSALANNGLFASALQEIGAAVVASVARRDHHAWSRAEVEAAIARARKSGASFLVTTGKDAAKIDPSWARGFPILSLRIELEVEGGDGLWALVRARLGLES